MQDPLEHGLVDHVVRIAVYDVEQLLDRDCAVERLEAALLDQVVDRHFRTVLREQIKHRVRDDVASGHVVDGAHEVVDDQMLHFLFELAVEHCADIEIIEDRDDRIGDDAARNVALGVHLACKDIDDVQQIAQRQIGLLERVDGIVDELFQIEAVKTLCDGLGLFGSERLFGKAEQVAQVDVRQRQRIVNDILDAQLPVILDEGLIDEGLVALLELLVVDDLGEQLVCAVQNRADLDLVEQRSVLQPCDDLVDGHPPDIAEQGQNARQVADVVSVKQGVLYVFKRQFIHVGGARYRDQHLRKIHVSVLQQAVLRQLLPDQALDIVDRKVLEDDRQRIVPSRDQRRQKLGLLHSIGDHVADSDDILQPELFEQAVQILAVVILSLDRGRNIQGEIILDILERLAAQIGVSHDRLDDLTQRLILDGTVVLNQRGIEPEAVFKLIQRDAVPGPNSESGYATDDEKDAGKESENKRSRFLPSVVSPYCLCHITLQRYEISVSKRVFRGKLLPGTRPE